MAGVPFVSARHGSARIVKWAVLASSSVRSVPSLKRPSQAEPSAWQDPQNTRAEAAQAHPAPWCTPRDPALLANFELNAISRCIELEEASRVHDAALFSQQGRVLPCSSPGEFFELFPILIWHFFARLLVSTFLMNQRSAGCVREASDQ